MTEELINLAADTVVYKSFVVSLGGDTIPETKKPKAVPDSEHKLVTANEVAYWGESNNLPDLIIAELEKNQDLGSLLDLQARILYAGGVDYDLLDPVTYEPLETKVDPTIEKFLKRNWMYPMQASQDFYKFFNFFPQFTLSKDRSQIVYLLARPANWCRLSTQNEKTHKVETCFINTDWSVGRMEKDDPKVMKLPTIDPILDGPEELKNRKDGLDYIYALSYPNGKKYYSIPNWWALTKSKWLELANKISAFKLALMTNQLTIKYHINIPDHHWPWKYPNWLTMSVKDKIEAKQKETKVLVDYLQGEEKAGKTLVTGYKFDEHKNVEYPGIKITAIDDKIKDGIYLEDSVEATIKIFTALGLDPSILGIVPGKGGSNRAGSDKREALNIYISIIQPHVDLILRPYDFVSDYNGWNNEKQIVRWRFKTPLLQTLDKVSPDKRQTVPEDSENDKEEEK